MRIVWYTGNSGAGKTTAARRFAKNADALLLDGDEMRKVWTDLGLSREDRWTQNLRIARLARLLQSQGVRVVVATICPYRELREEVQKITDCEFVYMKGGKSGPDYPYELSYDI